MSEKIRHFTGRKCLFSDSWSFSLCNSILMFILEPKIWVLKSCIKEHFSNLVYCIYILILTKVSLRRNLGNGIWGRGMFSVSLEWSYLDGL